MPMNKKAFTERVKVKRDVMEYELEERLRAQLQLRMRSKKKGTRRIMLVRSQPCVAKPHLPKGSLYARYMPY
jgi:hypothetical protein